MGASYACYFSTLKMPLLAGRAFNDADTAGSAKVVVVNESFVRKFFGRGIRRLEGRSPSGREKTSRFPSWAL